MTMVAVYSPKTDSEAAVIVSLMEAYGVDHFMQGGAFSSMYPGPLVNSLNAQTLMVHEDHADLARQLLQEFLA